MILTKEDFIAFGYEEDTAESLASMQTWLKVGTEVGVVIDHHTDEDLNTELEKFIISEIDWEQSQVRFENSDGFVNLSEVYEKRYKLEELISKITEENKHEDLIPDKQGKELL